ncbi:hypothetical protein SAMN05421842_1281, partial [Clostridium uliginosum]
IRILKNIRSEMFVRNINSFLLNLQLNYTRI